MGDPRLLGCLDAIEKLGNLDTGKRRIGKIITKKNYKSLSNCSIMNPDFESGNLNGRQGAEQVCDITKNGSMEQKIVQSTPVVCGFTERPDKVPRLTTL
jgi:hypothetical protein